VSSIVEKANARRTALREKLRQQYPSLLRTSAPRPPAVDRSAIVLGRNQGEAPVYLSERARLEHGHCIGTTGAGKTSFFRQCIEQDVATGRGVCVIDPHGNHPDSLYRSLLGWLDERGYTNTRVIHLIDPNTPTHVTGFDPLALPDETYDPAVIADAALEAFERVWGEEDTDTKPTIQRVLTATLTALCDLKLTLAEARLLFDPVDRAGIRAWAIENVSDEEAREELQYLHDIAGETRGRQEFRKEVLGPRNRLGKLTRTEAVRTMIGQQAGTGRAIDFRKALDEGHIILANLAGGPRASDKACELLGRLLTRFLFFHAQRRRCPERPFFFYLDECQLYLSGDVSRMLAECRKYGVGVMLSHQYLGQLDEAGPDILQAVRNCTNLKVVFRLKDPEEAEDLAHMVVPLDLEMPLRASVRPTAVGVELVKLKGESTSEQSATTAMHTESKGESYAETDSYVQSFAETYAEGVSETHSDASSLAAGTSRAKSSGLGSGLTTTETMTPGLGLLGSPMTIGLSEGESAMAHSAEMRGGSAMKASSTGSARGSSSMHAVTTGEAWGQAVSRGVQTSTSIGHAETRGRADTHGTQESFKPVYQDLPASFHGKENALYFAAQTLRGLTTGKAFLNFMDKSGPRAGLLTVPNVDSRAPSETEFEALRARVFALSPSASPIAEARAHVARRQLRLAESAEQARAPVEPETPAGFRTKRKRLSVRKG
jgi:TraM recognition site of TraD and TraG